MTPTLTITEAAALWHSDPSYIRRLCEKGRIPGAYKTVVNGRCRWEIPMQDRPEKRKPGFPAKRK